MSHDCNKIDLLVQYALLLAGEEDDGFDQRLGPIHLIKYVYLADLAYAERHGESFTGVDWRFYNFGPWSEVVYERVAPAVRAIHAEERKYESKFGDDDWVRYRLRDRRLLDEIERRVPSPVALRLKNHVHRFLSDTPSLLDYVYKTEPMIAAAPNENLDFSKAAKPKYETPESPPSRMDTASAKKRKRLAEGMRKLRENPSPREVTKLVSPVPNPRYDEVYKQGSAWLDQLAGQPFEDIELTAEFSDEVWKSAARKGEDVP